MSAATAVCERHLQRDPDGWDRIEHRKSQRMMADALLSQGRSSEAVVLYEAIVCEERTDIIIPTHAGQGGLKPSQRDCELHRRVLLACTLDKLAAAYMVQGRHSEALAALEEAIAAQQAAVTSPPRNYTVSNNHLASWIEACTSSL